MKSMLYRTPAKTISRLTPKTPMSRQNSAETITDPVRVYCRIRPTNGSNETSCVEVISDKTVSLRPPETTSSQKIMRETQYTFQKVFKSSSSQSNVYECVGRPLVEDLINGKNGLLFTYGVTSSGKTFTMTGNQENRGVMPRCLEDLFKTISGYQAKKFVFKPDRMNGFEILSDVEAMELQQEEMIARFGIRNKQQRKDSDPEIASQASAEASALNGIDEDNVYAIFVTYIEVYNNSVYDLLEDSPVQKSLQAKIIRSDASSNMYVHGVTEVEVKSVKEAIDAYHTGQKRKRSGHTLLNAESSRSHSVFTIRLVQASTDIQGELTKNSDIMISQLSLVDLAGSERTNRTNNTGQRLREASNINNSLMTLRKCLEILRENQASSIQKMVPYRDAKITHLFKNYFDGEGHVRMIVCINPRPEDFDETSQVMKFAEMTQEVQVVRPTPMKIDNGFTPGRRKANKIFKIATQNLESTGRHEARKLDVDIGLVYSLGPKFPEYQLISPETDELIAQLMIHLDQRIKKRVTLLDDHNVRLDEFRMKLARTEKEMNELRIEKTELSRSVEYERNRNQAREKMIDELEFSMEKLKRELNERNSFITDLQEQNNQKDRMLREMEHDQQRQKRRFDSKLVYETEKTSRQIAKEFRDKQEALNDCIRSKTNQMRQIQQIVNSKNSKEFEETPIITKDRFAITNSVVPTPRSARGAPAPKTLRGVPVANRRHRRSKSTEGRYVEHRSPNPVPLGTILQPYYHNRPKSITKLTDAKDITNTKSARYCLVSQGADTDGEVETRLYKGDIIPTCGGGAQVVFNDVECLKQRSPVNSPRRKRIIDYENIPMIDDSIEMVTPVATSNQERKRYKY